MHRHAQPAERLHQAFHSVRQIIRRGGERHDRRTDDQKGKADRHFHRRFQSLPGDGQTPDGHEGTARREKEVENHSKNKKKQNRLHAFYHEFEGHMG